MAALQIHFELFHHNKIVVLLALLHKDILAVDEVGWGHHLVQSDLFLVDTHAVGLGHLAGFALRGEDLRVDGHKVNDRDAGFEVTLDKVKIGRAHV